MSQKKIGALIAIEKDIDLSPYAQRGRVIDAELSKDLLVSIFSRNHLFMTERCSSGGIK